MATVRSPYLMPPRYDIDAVLDVDRTARLASDRIVQDIWGALDAAPQGVEPFYYRPDSALLAPEVTLRDLCMFDATMGNGWAVSLGYSGGLLLFFRGLRALRTIGHRRGVAMAETVLGVLKKHGIPELTTFADDPLYGWCDDWDREALEKYQRGVWKDVDWEVGWSGLDLDGQWWEVSHSYWDKHERLVVEDPPVSYALCEYLDRNREALRCRKPGGQNSGEGHEELGRSGSPDGNSSARTRCTEPAGKNVRPTAVVGLTGGRSPAE